MSRFVFRIVFILVLLVIELYAYNGLSLVFKKSIWVKVLYALSTIVVVGTIVYMMSGHHLLRGGRAPWQNLLFGLTFTFVVTKLLYAGMLVIADSTRIVEWVGRRISGNPFSGEDLFFPSRRDFVGKAIAGLAALPFAAMIFGITRGKYAYTVENVTVSIKGLPKAFDGFKILQISDIHAGSFDSRDRVSAGIGKCNEQGADMIVFTGDLVNSEKEEIDPYADIFARLKAPFGQYGIMGNHDYYGWYRKKDKKERNTYEKEMHCKFDDIGFDLLLDEHRYIEKDGERICLAGVENWGAGPFMKKGDFDKAILDADPDVKMILLSHDPSHWGHEVTTHGRKVDLTLSGHTHGFQFGINLPGMKWSPAKWRYPHWMGLYEQDDQYLYVNRGFGFLGFPGRVGMTPEITVLELKAV